MIQKAVGVFSDGVAKAAAAVALPPATSNPAAVHTSPRDGFAPLSSAAGHSGSTPPATPDASGTAAGAARATSGTRSLRSAAASSARPYEAPEVRTRLSYLNLAACGLHSDELMAALVECIETNSPLVRGGLDVL